MEFHRNPKGVEEILKSAGMAAEVAARSAVVASGVQSQVPGKTVLDEAYDFVPKGRTSGRAARVVVLAEPNGRAIQAKHGVMTRAAAAVGLEVKEHPDG